ncbi:hypothetical protein HYALB_00005092 [Hymenoscyphus albidus]|uniref:Uncharacterized protein n=1 Tax=Hymenoscyphus albidus TaxID=595503 RepID=A0A9N9LZJ1_9HELO|nr:hypothetical protein HYALB_00005092 [Hymenoscyphus albidus]
MTNYEVNSFESFSQQEYDLLKRRRDPKHETQHSYSIQSTNTPQITAPEINKTISPTLIPGPSFRLAPEAEGPAYAA